MVSNIGRYKFGAVSAMLLCSVVGSITTLESYSASHDVEWSASEFPIPFTFDPQTDSDVQASPVNITLSITDSALNQNSASVETVILTPMQDSDDLTIQIEGAGGLTLVSASEISSCSRFDSAQFIETGANTAKFEKTFKIDGCGLEPEELANAKLIAKYGDERDSAIFRGYSGKLETSAKQIYTGLEVKITVIDEDQNKNTAAVESVKIEFEPDDLAPEFKTLEETGVNTGVFTKTFLIGKDLKIIDNGLIDDVLVRYVDAVTSDGSKNEKKLTLSVQTNSAELTSSPASKITPRAKILVTLSDKDINEDPQAKDIIDYGVLLVQTNNDEISDSEIKLGEDGFKIEETDKNSGIFQFDIVLVPAIKLDEIEFSATLGELEIPTEPSDRIVVSYKDKSHSKTPSLTIYVESFDPVIKTDKEKYYPGDVMTVTIEDPDANMDFGLAESNEVRVYSETDTFGNFFSATETGKNTGVFTFQVDIEEEFGQDAVVAVLGDHLTIEYEDLFPEDHGGASVFMTSIPVGDKVSTDKSAETSEPVAKDINGGAVENVTVDQHVVLSTKIENSLDDKMNFVALIEVRDSEGITVYLAWQSGTLEPGGQAEVGLTWVPYVAGEYDIRTFVLSSLAIPEVLSSIKQSGLNVV